VLADECERANLAFFTWARHARAAFTLKAAITLDGKIATVAGQSQWITGEAARADVHRLRDTHDAVLVGIGTVLADDPRLTVRIGQTRDADRSSTRGRLPRARDPIRIVLDSQLRTPPRSRLLPRSKGPRTILACGERAPAAREHALVRAGAEIWRLPVHRGGRVRLPELARRLGREGITSVLVEGGGEVHAAFLEARLADELVIYIAPKVVGGPAPSWVGGRGLGTLAAAYRFELGEPVRVGEDLRVIATRRS
ncbi:MAG TPA: RibD family protein, partial [Kofleriaceae bacterium]|nr:RibD family protein [Kofleriaceae bacterium]